MVSEEHPVQVSHDNKLARFYFKAYVFLTITFILIGLAGWLL